MNNSAEDSVLSIQVLTGHIANEELGAIGVWTRVRHRKKSFVSVPDPNSFIRKFASIDTSMTFSISIDLASLHHELRDHSLNLAAVVVQIASQFA